MGERDGEKLGDVEGWSEVGWGVVGWGVVGCGVVGKGVVGVRVGWRVVGLGVVGCGVVCDGIVGSGVGGVKLVHSAMQSNWFKMSTCPQTLRVQHSARQVLSPVQPS